MTIPSTFTEAQAELILDLAEISMKDGGDAMRQLQAWTPTHFTESQAECISELLALNAHDMRATLADAMEPCELQRRLRD